MDILNPIPSAAPVAVSPLSPRPVDLRGTRVGVLDNSKPNADALLGRVAELLVEIVVAGGPGKHSSIVPTFGATRSVTVRV